MPVATELTNLPMPVESTFRLRFIGFDVCKGSVDPNFINATATEIVKMNTKDKVTANIDILGNLLLVFVRREAPVRLIWSIGAVRFII